MNGRDLAGLRILIVEDTFLLADMLAEQLTEHGCDVVGPAPRVAKALSLVQHERLDGALLDVNLAGEYCFPVAEALRDLGVPVAFLSGYGEAALPEEFRAAPRLAKPFTMDQLTRLMVEHFRPRGGHEFPPGVAISMPPVH